MKRAGALCVNGLTEMLVSDGWHIVAAVITALLRSHPLMTAALGLMDTERIP